MPYDVMPRKKKFLRLRPNAMFIYRDVSGALETSVIFQNGGNFQNRRRDATNVKMARNNSKQPRISLKMPIK